MDTKRNETTLFFLLIIVSSIIFFLDRAGILTRFRGLVEGIVSPGAREVHKLATLGQTFDAEFGQEKQQELERLKIENEDLRLQLGITKGNTNQNLKMTHVLSTRRSFIIDMGAENGIETGNVVVFKNILIGKVDVTSKRTSKVLLSSEKGSIIEVKATQTGAKGLVKGLGERMVLAEVTLSENLSEGDTLTTIGDVDEKGLGIRPGLLVGKIENIHKSEDQLFQEASVVPLIDTQKLQNVFVVF